MTKSLIKVFVIIMVISIAACVKKDDYFSYDQSTPNRKQTVKIANASDIVTIARDVTPTIDTIEVIDLRRAPNDNAQLNQPLTVKLVRNPTLISDYNTANGTSFIELPANAYTVLGDLNNITFQPGEDIKEIKIRLDKSNMDLTEQYALGFSIADAGSASILTSSKNGLYNIGVKNKYDGIYELHGMMLRAGDNVLSGPTGPYEIPFATAGPASVLWNAPVPWANGSNSTLPPGYNPIITVNANNSLTLASSGGIPNWTQTSTYNQHYDPNTKTFYLQFTWGAGPASRLSTDTLYYLRPR